MTDDKHQQLVELVKVMQEVDDATGYGWGYDDDDDHDEPDVDDDPDADPDECCLGSACLNPHPYHFASECFDIEMAESSMSYTEQEGKLP